MLISPIFVYYLSSDKLLSIFPLWELLGLRIEGLSSATFIPLILTAVLYLGPISVQLSSGIWRIYSGA